MKTAPGAADYAVVLKYGGELGALGSLDRVDFPLIRTLNIHVELSQVELHVPPTHRWFNFSGTMRLVQDEGDLAADWLAYNTKQIGLAIQSMKSSDEYSRARAMNNLKSLQTESEQLKKAAQSYRGNEQLAQQLKGNSAIQLGLQPELQAEPGRPIEGIDDNREKLRGRFDEQRNGRASGVVNQAGENFVAQDEDEERSVPLQPPGSAGGGPQGQAISGKWLAKNKLGKDLLPPSEMPQDRREGGKSRPSPTGRRRRQQNRKALAESRELKTGIVKKTRTRTPPPRRTESSVNCNATKSGYRSNNAGRGRRRWPVDAPALNAATAAVTTCTAVCLPMAVP